MAKGPEETKVTKVTVPEVNPTNEQDKATPFVTSRALLAAAGAVAAQVAPAVANAKPTSYKVGLGYQYNFNPAVDIYTDFGYVWNQNAYTNVTNGFILSGGNSYAADVGLEWWW